MLLRHIKLGLVALTALVGATSCLDKYPDSAIPEKMPCRRSPTPNST